MTGYKRYSEGGGVDRGGYCLGEVAKAIGVSRERARQIEEQALKKLAHPRLRAKWENILETIKELREIENRRGIGEAKSYWEV